SNAALHAPTASSLFQRFRLNRGFLSCRPLLPILPDPSFPALADRSIASAESQRCNVRIRNAYARTAVRRQHPNKRLLERVAALAVIDIAFHNGSVFTRDRHISAIVKRLFQRLADRFLSR